MTIVNLHNSVQYQNISFSLNEITVLGYILIRFVNYEVIYPFSNTRGTYNWFLLDSSLDYIFFKIPASIYAVYEWYSVPG